jgi:hypothetical protein
MSDPAGVRFDLVRRHSIRQVLVTLLAVGGDWSASEWSIWAVASDGRRFRVKDQLDEGTARYTVKAFEGQLALTTPREWARSKGFTELAAHLDRLAQSS